VLDKLHLQDNDVNRLILAKRLQLCGHAVVNTMNGKEGVDMIEVDRSFDCILMDVQCV
jgi:CheY-like chemotaxis protein